MSSHSRVSPSGGNGSGSNNPERPRLTDAEKKQNHILSEQKRRQAIRQGFDRLAAMTPGMEGMGRSEAAVLSASVAEIKEQTRIKEALKRKLLREGHVDGPWFEGFYRIHNDEVAARNNGPAAASSSSHRAPTHSPAASTASSNGSASKSQSQPQYQGKGKQRVNRENE